VKEGEGGISGNGEGLDVGKEEEGVVSYGSNVSSINHGRKGERRGQTPGCFPRRGVSGRKRGGSHYPTLSRGCAVSLSSREKKKKELV